MLFAVVSSIDTADCDDPEAFEPHIAAATAMQSVISCVPDESGPVLVALIQQFSGSESVGERDASLHVLNFLIQFCDVTSLLDESLALIFERLSDPADRIRQTAIYCVHALLQSILNGGDDCPFASRIPEIGQRIVDMSSVVLNLMGGVPPVAATAASAAADFVQFPRFPYVGLAMGHLLSAAIQGDFRLSEAAFSSLQSAVPLVSNRVLHPLTTAIADILTAALGNPETDFRIIYQFYSVLQNILVKLGGDIGDMIERLWELMNRTFEQYPNEAPSILSPLAALARAAGAPFLPYLDQTAEFLLAGLRTIDREDIIARAAQGITLLSDSFDLAPFATGFLEALTAVMAPVEIPLPCKRFVADAIADLARGAPGEFAAVAEEVLPAVIAVSDVLGDVIEAVDPDDDDFDPEATIISILKCLQQALDTLIAAQAPAGPGLADAVFELLEFIGGLKEHSDELLEASVETMGFMIAQFPDPMRQSFQSEPGFEVLLREAAAAGVFEDGVQEIAAFVGLELDDSE
jgi:hypothetical protein